MEAKGKTEHDHHMIHLAERIEALLIELAMQREDANRPTQREVITLSGSVYPFSANGYRYNGMYVSGGQTVTVEYRGFQYSQVLQAGWNQMNLPDGCTVSTAGEPFMAEIVRENEQFSTMVTEVAGQVSLTGNSAPHAYTLTSAIEIPYTKFVSSTGVAQGYNINLAITRNAIRRLFLINNGINVEVSGYVWPVDSNTNGLGLALILGEANAMANFSVGASSQSPYSTSPGNSWADTDQLTWDASTGSSVATTGNLYINVYEMF